MTGEHVFVCQGRPRLTADVTEGTIFIRGWDGDSIRVEDCSGAEIKQRGSKIILDSSRPCSCKIYLPRNSDVSIDGTNLEIDMAGIRGQGTIDFTNGSVFVENWQGDLEIDCSGGNVRLCQCRGKAGIDTSSGNVEILSSEGNFVCDTGSGSVKVQDSSGSVSADTGSGQVQVSQFRGPVHIDTGKGDVELQFVFGRNVYADCGSGSITATLPGPVPGRWELVTRSGEIDLRAPENISARFEFRGRQLDVGDLGLDSVEQGEKRIKGRLGRGEGNIIAASSSGGISARRVAAAAVTAAHWQVQDEESLKILRMLEQGTISIDEADKLLAALNGEDQDGSWGTEQLEDTGLED